MKLIDKKYYSVYLVLAIILACFIFMLGSTAVIMKNVGGGKTSMDLALEKAKKTCSRENGKLVKLNRNDPLDTACIVGERPSDGKN